MASADISWVDTSSVEFGIFQQELLSNGKLEAVKKAELRFSGRGNISEIHVKNGTRVSKGSLIAQLDDQYQEIVLAESKAALERADLDLQDAFISFGYLNAPVDSIPPNIIKAAEAKSGYTQAKSNLAKAEYEWTQTRMIAPFAGIIANMESHSYTQADQSKAFCLLIDDRNLEVSFKILESEIAEIKLGQAVEVSPFSLEEIYTGVISEINPFIDENAMIKVKARIPNKGRKLISGMNVKVRMKKAVPNQLIIPKEALVLRQGRPVVFTWQNDTAIWKYVETGLENSTHLSIKSGLEKEDIVIGSGNLNLAHKAPVKVKD
ncbi:MAG: efflux RND transporter periplasmic adaptor subunit [Bacteroidota bacterium]